MFDLKIIENKIADGQALSASELLFLYELPDLTTLSYFANIARKMHNDNVVVYNRNFHLEPSNICKHHCLFCSFRKELVSDDGAWDMTLEDVKRYCLDKYSKGITEIHIVGSVHPEKDLSYYMNIIKTVRQTLPPEVSIKAFSAIEIIGMKGEFSLKECLASLKGVGLDSLPGGGAEILVDSIREKICPDKANSEQWLDVHRQAHKLNIASNATMMFGHIESRKDRIEHLLRIRELQSETNGFMAFIPLKYRNSNNEAAKLFSIKELSDQEVLRTFAISRIALNNVKHIKAYWPMLGKELTKQALLFGADDIDGTINDSTKIYSEAGAEEQHPNMGVYELEKIANEAGFIAKERNTFYN